MATLFPYTTLCRSPGLDISATSVALQLYTSGTTGKPKGAMLSHHSLNSVRLSQPASVAWTAWKADDVRLISMRSEEHTSELQSLMRLSYAVYCLHKKHNRTTPTYSITKLSYS